MGNSRIKRWLCLVAVVACFQCSLPAREEARAISACAPPALATAKTLVAGQSSFRGNQGEMPCSIHPEHAELFLASVLLLSLAMAILMPARPAVHPLRPSSSGLEDEILRTGSAIFGFGANDAGQLAVGDIKGRCFPAMVQGGVSVSTEADAQVITGAPIVSVSAGGFHTLLLDAEGSVFAVGENFHGQLGCGRTKLVCVVPQLCTSGTGNQTLPPMRSVSAGLKHSLFLARDGRVFACGCGKRGKLGFDTSTDVNLPREMKTFKLSLRRTRRPMGVTKDGFLIDEEECSSDIEAYRTQYWKKDSKIRLWHNASGFEFDFGKKRKSIFGVENEPFRTQKKVRRKLDRGKPFNANKWEMYNIMLLLQEKKSLRKLEEDWKKTVEEQLSPVEGEERRNLTTAIDETLELMENMTSGETIEGNVTDDEKLKILNSMTSQELEVFTRMNFSAVMNKFNGNQFRQLQDHDLTLFAVCSFLCTSRMFSQTTSSPAVTVGSREAFSTTQACFWRPRLEGELQFHSDCHNHCLFLLSAAFSSSTKRPDEIVGAASWAGDRS
eukprot:765386-Hanusia_phi.AAC.6